MELFNELMNLYKEIKNIYSELKILEFIGHKEDNEFLKLVNILKNKINRENKLIKCLVKECNYDYDRVYDSIYDSVIEYGDEFRKRLLERLNMYERLYAEIDYSQNEEDVVEQEMQLKLDRLYTLCCRSIYLVYYSFLQDFIDSSSFIRLRGKLLDLKYSNSFVNSDVEFQLVNNNFIINKDNYVDLYFMVQYLGLDGNMCDEVILDTCLDNITTSFIELLWIKDNDYEDKDKMVKSIEYQCMARAGLAMLSENDYKKVIDIINDEISKLKNDTNKVSRKIIEKIFESRLSDKSRIKKLSMTPLED